jgi:hypothetical protein
MFTFGHMQRPEWDVGKSMHLAISSPFLFGLSMGRAPMSACSVRGVSLRITRQIEKAY